VYGCLCLAPRWLKMHWAWHVCCSTEHTLSDESYEVLYGRWKAQHWIQLHTSNVITSTQFGECGGRRERNERWLSSQNHWALLQKYEFRRAGNTKQSRCLLRTRKRRQLQKQQRAAGAAARHGMYMLLSGRRQNDRVPAGQWGQEGAVLSRSSAWQDALHGGKRYLNR